MALPFSLFLGTLSFVSTVQSVAFPGPEPTVFTDRYGQGFSPKPTGMPELGDLELRKRLIGIDPNTCGWVDGDPSSAVSCHVGRTCMLYTPSDTVGMAGCCTAGDLQNCGWRTRCVDSLGLSTCTDANCLSNPFVLVCSQATAAFCVSWTYPSDAVQDYGCDTDPASTWQTIHKDISSGGITTSLNLPYAAQNAVTGWSSAKSTIKVSTTSSTSTPAASSSAPKKKVPIGAIVGGVVGGLFLILCIVGLIVGLCIWKRRSNKTPPVIQPPAVNQQQQPLMSQSTQAMRPQQPQGYYPSGPAPVYTQSQQYGGYPSDNKLGPGVQAYPVPSGSPSSTPISAVGSAWSPPSATPLSEIRPVSQAWSSIGPPAGSPPPAVEVPADQKPPQHVPATNQQHPSQHTNPVYEMGS